MAKHDPQSALAKLLDASIPIDHRMHMFLHGYMAGGEEGKKVAEALMEAAARGNGESLYNEKLAQLNSMIEEMQAGPLRSAMFFRMFKGNNGAAPRAEVRFQDGEAAYVVVPNAALAATLRCGDAVLIEPHGKAVLGRDPEAIVIGEEVRFERRIDGKRIEVTLHDHETHYYEVSAALGQQLDAGAMPAGARMLADARRRVALELLAGCDALANLRFLSREPVPDVVAARDIGCPPQYIEEFAEHVRMWMTRPELGHRYRLRRALSKLLTGVSGSGKTLSIYALWRRLYEVMSEVTGLPIEQLPPRVFWLRIPEIFTKWFGDSEKHLARFFDEVELVADQKIVGVDGREYAVPTLGICEEVDGLARARGTGEAIGERIQTTALERLDVNSPRMRDRLILLLSTTNVPGMVDQAFLRRAGGTMTHFGRLSRAGFSAVLAKHLRGRRFRDDYGPQAEAERRALQEVAGWLYSPNGYDHGQFEITFVGAATPEVKYRRDLLTGALVDRAVDEASGEACRADFHGAEQPGLSGPMLIAAFERQIGSIVEQLTPHNLSNYVTIPEGARAGAVRRLQQPSLTPFQLMRAS
jgi:hypothetical protein